MRRPGIRFARKNLYTLKRRFGFKADWYNYVSAVDDSASGQSIFTFNKYTLNRAILLPIAMNVEINIQGGFRKVNSQEPSAGESVDTRLIVIDGMDMPNNTNITSKDYFVIEGDRYNVKSSVQLEGNVGTLVTALYALGEDANQEYDLNIMETLAILEEINNTVSYNFPISLKQIIVTLGEGVIGTGIGENVTLSAIVISLGTGNIILSGTTP